MRLSELRDAGPGFAIAVAIDEGYRDPQAVKTNLRQFSITGRTLETRDGLGSSHE